MRMRAWTTSTAVAGPAATRTRARRWVLGATTGAILAASAGASTASGAGQSVTMPFTAAPFTSPCTGEPMLITGTSHMVFNSSGGQITGEANLQGVSGTGLVTGLRYVDQTQQTDWTRLTPDGGSAGHVEFSEHLIRQKETTTLAVPDGDDFYAKILLHVVFDSNGTPTVRQDMSSDGCR